jgi:hypothetical protein
MEARMQIELVRRRFVTPGSSEPQPRRQDRQTCRSSPRQAIWGHRLPLAASHCPTKDPLMLVREVEKWK